VLIPAQKKFAFSDEQVIQALYVAAGFGQVIAQRASISGAAGGCQAEIGAASAMGAAALTALKGGTPEQMAHACAMALKNLLGLVCDPVAGLVEVPCVKRNVVGAMNALACAEMALAGIPSAIPCDEVIDAMGSVGDALPASLRETGQGGLAATPTGRRVKL
jgi:L-serine dehydratase